MRYSIKKLYVGILGMVSYNNNNEVFNFTPNDKNKIIIFTKKERTGDFYYIRQAIDIFTKTKYCFFYGNDVYHKDDILERSVGTFCVGRYLPLSQFIDDETRTKISIDELKELYDKLNNRDVKANKKNISEEITDGFLKLILETSEKAKLLELDDEYRDELVKELLELSEEYVRRMLNNNIEKESELTIWKDTIEKLIEIEEKMISPEAIKKRTLNREFEALKDRIK